MARRGTNRALWIGGVAVLAAGAVTAVALMSKASTSSTASGGSGTSTAGGGTATKTASPGTPPGTPPGGQHIATGGGGGTASTSGGGGQITTPSGGARGSIAANPGGGGPTATGASPGGSQFASSGGASTHGQTASAAPPTQGQAYARSWPGDVLTTMSTSTAQVSSDVTMRVGDSLAAFIVDPTATPACQPVASTRPGWGVTCDSWTVSWVDANGVAWTADALGQTAANPLPVQAMAGESDPATQLATQANLVVAAVKPGRGTLVFQRLSPSGVVDLTWAMKVTVGP